MLWYHYLLIAVAVLLVSVIVVVLVRTLLFKPQKTVVKDYETESFDKDSAVKALQELVKCKTISDFDKSNEDENEFKKLYDLLPKLYPNVIKTCQNIPLKNRGLLYKWEGVNHDNVTVLMAHFDVVSVVEENWEKPPFDGVIEDGVLWGRGTLDTKVTFNGVMFSVNHLIEKGFKPKNDIYLAFSGEEEINGQGAVEIVEYFKENNISPYLVIDEGGAVVENVFPGVKNPCALVGIAEKGMMNLKFTNRSMGGHASAPKPHTPIGILARACSSVENNPFKAKLTTPVKAMFDTLGRHSTFVYRMIFANLWLFKGVLDLICKKSGGELNAMMRTTVAFTQAEGSQGVNVIPPVASMTANMRINPLDSVQIAKDYIKKVVNDDSVEITKLMSMEPSPISIYDCEQFNRVINAINGTWGGDVLVSPYLMVQCSDSRHYKDISKYVYRFSCMDLTSEERKTIHGNNERIRLEVLNRAVEFYIRLIKQC